MHGWGLWIQHSLTHVSLGPLDSQLIVLFILQPFDRYLTETLSDPQRRFLSRFLSLFFNGDFKRTFWLTEFFSDPSRSGPFYLDGDKYATVAINFTKYLIKEMYVCESFYFSFSLACKCSTPPSTMFYFELLVHLSSLPFLLTQASHSIELATLLNSELLSLIRRYRPDLVLEALGIVKKYCDKVCSNLHIYLRLILLIDNPNPLLGITQRFILKRATLLRRPRKHLS